VQEGAEVAIGRRVGAIRDPASDVTRRTSESALRSARRGQLREARPDDGPEADDGTWWRFRAPTFSKQTPTTDTTGLGSPVSLQWTALAGEGYWVRWDTSDNGTCDSAWQPNGSATTKPLYGLPVGTYYWQVKTAGSGLEADEGTWWRFTVTVPYVAPDHWKAEYFGNATLSGAPVATVDEGTGFVDHSWGTGGPAGLADHFSARFTRTVPLAAGTYRFTLTTDDGSQFWVDDQLQVNAWGADGLTTHTVDLDLAAGAHALRVQYVEHMGGATARLTWAPVLEVPAGVWTAEYFANMGLSGSPASTVEEVSAFIDHPWGDGGPETLPVDGFSARFTRTLSFPAGTYRFTVVTDDGSRLWIDDQLVIDAWWDQGPTPYTADVTLSAGDHTVRYEFYENSGGAVAQLSWAFTAAPEPEPAASATVTGRSGPADGGPPDQPSALAVVNGAIVALIALGTLALWRLRDRLGRRLPATALFLTALLLVPVQAPAQTPTQVVEYYHTDALGSVRAVTKQVNGEWQVVARHDFMPFGEEVAPPNPPQEKRLFTGKERDSETGLDYFGARYCRAEIGRFTTVDPAMTLAENLVDPQRWNRYNYAKGNPLFYVDPDGRDILVVVKANIVGSSTINRHTAEEMRNDPKLEQVTETVPTYALAIRNDSGASYETEVTRDTNHRGTSSATRGDYRLEREAPPGVYGGRVRTFGNAGDALELLDPKTGSNRLTGPAGTREAIGIHIGPGCSLGCLLLKGGRTGRDDFITEIGRMVDQDRKSNLGTKIRIVLLDRNMTLAPLKIRQHLDLPGGQQ